MKPKSEDVQITLPEVGPSVQTIIELRSISLCWGIIHHALVVCLSCRMTTWWGRYVASLHCSWLVLWLSPPFPDEVALGWRSRTVRAALGYDVVFSVGHSGSPCRDRNCVVDACGNPSMANGPHIAIAWTWCFEKTTAGLDAPHWGSPMTPIPRISSKQCPVFLPLIIRLYCGAPSAGPDNTHPSGISTSSIPLYDSCFQ